MKRTARKPTNLSESLHQRLNSYALAASAAAVSLLALPQPAEGRIVYHRADRLLHCGRTPLDLNHDGVADFYFLHTGCSGIVSQLSISPAGRAGRNLIWGYTSTFRGRGFASALKAGVKIHASKKLLSGNAFMIACAAGASCEGPWYNPDGLDAYLGLKFNDLKGRTHYGWARVWVLGSGSATLTGYAYETVPNKSIIAGKTHGKDVITVQPATLGHLARGASAIPAWRQKQSIGDKQ
jgi:hypothetical protein